GPGRTNLWLQGQQHRLLCLRQHWEHKWRLWKTERYSSSGICDFLHAGWRPGLHIILVFDYAAHPLLFPRTLVMRYLLHHSQLNELKARQAYLYDIFHMYFLPGKPEGSYIPLVPLGAKGPDVLFITGHTQQVHAYLNAYFNQIPERC